MTSNWWVVLILQRPCELGMTYSSNHYWGRSVENCSAWSPRGGVIVRSGIYWDVETDDGAVTNK